MIKRTTARKTISPLDLAASQAQSAKPSTTKFLFRIDEAVDLLNISKQKVVNLIDSGELEAVVINSALDDSSRRHRRITSRSLETFINSRKNTQQ